MLSLTKLHHYYQTFLSQGLGIGLGMGCLFLPDVSIVLQYFRARWSLAMGCVVEAAAADFGPWHPSLASEADFAHVEAAAATHHRLVSTPVRQPRGPPSGAEELGPKNFATRIRRKAIGGLGALMGARERREVVEAY